MIRFDESVLHDVEQALSREWLETNALGAFACSSLAGANTRRYHGLLTTCARPPVGRQLLLSKLEDSVTVAGERYEFSSNQYEGALHPQGFRHLRGFRLDPWPVFTFEAGGALIEKSIFLLRDRPAVAVAWELMSCESELDIDVRPLIAFRDYHSTTHANSSIDPTVEVEDGLVRLKPYAGLPDLYLAHSGRDIEPLGQWYYNFFYERERERGLDFQEDLFCPLQMRGKLSTGKPFVIIASTKAEQVSGFERLRQQERKARSVVRASAPRERELVADLTVAADQFIARRGDGFTVMAGYPWFTDWGRDTMIALPGLTLAPGREAIARSILRTFASNISEGMVPNHFPDQGELPAYNTVDASLWYFEAVRGHLDRTGDASLRDELYPVLLDILERHIHGTRFNIHLRPDGLLESGEPGVQLTWMDAKVGDWVVTPRTGLPVEIQALWYNALCIVSKLAEQRKDQANATRFAKIAASAKKSFNQLFWSAELGCLYDVVDGERRDASIRPNQIFAVSLPHTMLPATRARRIVDVVRSHLLTPYGLRTLSPSDADYRGRYQGGPLERDGAYHQGTVWPWLLGPFVTAFVKVNGRTAAARREAESMFAAFPRHLLEAGIGQVSEIFDGDAPHAPRGCIAQAWSVAELLRALCEDVYSMREPKPRKPAARAAKR